MCACKDLDKNQLTMMYTYISPNHCCMYLIMYIVCLCFTVSSSRTQKGYAFRSAELAWLIMKLYITIKTNYEQHVRLQLLYCNYMSPLHAQIQNSRCLPIIVWIM